MSRAFAKLVPLIAKFRQYYTPFFLICRVICLVKLTNFYETNQKNDLNQRRRQNIPVPARLSLLQGSGRGFACPESFSFPRKVCILNLVVQTLRGPPLEPSSPARRAHNPRGCTRPLRGNQKKGL